MAKYKYVDGVKYRVVPQSVLGYALVREDSDNSLPSGGTEGQVLGKASDADYDVEWMTVEGGGGEGIFFAIDVVLDSTTGYFTFADETKIPDYINNISNGKIPVVTVILEDGVLLCSNVAVSDDSVGEVTEYYITASRYSVGSDSVIETGYSVTLIHDTEYSGEVGNFEIRYPSIN